jgi:hypothetical protein
MRHGDSFRAMTAFLRLEHRCFMGSVHLPSWSTSASWNSWSMSASLCGALRSTSCASAGAAASRALLTCSSIAARLAPTPLTEPASDGAVAGTKWPNKLSQSCRRMAGMIREPATMQTSLRDATNPGNNRAKVILSLTGASRTACGWLLCDGVACSAVAASFTPPAA